MIVPGITFLGPLGNQVFVTAATNPKPDYLAHGFAWMNDGSLCLNTSNVPQGSSVTFNKGFAFGPKGALYATMTPSASDVWLAGVRISTKGAVVFQSTTCTIYNNANTHLTDGTVTSN